MARRVPTTAGKSFTKRPRVVLTERRIHDLEPDPRKDVFLRDAEVVGFGVRCKPSGSKGYFVEYRVGGVTNHRMYLGPVGTLKLATDGERIGARDLARRELAKARAGGDPLEQRRAKRGEKSVSELAKWYLGTFLPGKKRPPKASTLRCYRSLIDGHIEPTLGRRRVSTVSVDDVEALHTAMSATPYHANRARSLLHGMFRAAEAKGWRAPGSNPVTRTGVQPYREESRVEQHRAVMTAAEIKRFLKACDDAKRGGADPFAVAAIRFTFATGWRPISEVCRLRWEDLDLEKRQARLSDTKIAKAEIRTLPKSAVGILRKLPRIVGNPHVFPGRERKLTAEEREAGEAPRRTHLASLKRPWQAIRDAAGLDGRRLYDLRHTRVSWSYAATKDEATVGKLAGHRSAATTRRYLEHLPEVLLDVADRADAEIARKVRAVRSKRAKPKGADVVDIERARATPSGRRGRGR
jgi:integrase